MASLLTFVVKDATEIRDDFLRTMKNGLIARGVEAPNVSPNSDWWVLGTALGNELAVIGANAVVKADAQMPDSAEDDDLGRIGDVLRLDKQPAGGSVGAIIIESSATSPIATGTELQDVSGLRYRVSVGGTFANGALVQIEAIDTGSATNHPEGDVLKWKAAPPYCSDKVIVAPGGLVNAIDAEDDEALRARVLAKFQVPPGSGNWQHVAELAEEADPRVQKAFVYPAVQGPSTVDVVVVAAPTATSKERDIETPVLTGRVAPYVVGKLPEHAGVTVTTAVNVAADVAFALSIPEAPTANPPGQGGGWVNGTPWPAPDGNTTFRCSVSSVTSSTVFVVDAATAPLPGVSRIAWLSPSEWRLFTALVTAVSGSAGAYTITLDQPLSGIVAGCYIWPEAENGQALVDSVLAAFALMGPGEKTANVSALVRGFRHPTPQTSWPYTLGPHLLRALVTAVDEVQDADFFYRTDGTTNRVGSGGALVPQVATLPNILMPRHIAFYRLPD